MEPLPPAVRLLVAASFVIALGYGIVAPALPVFARSFDVGVTAVSFVATAFAVVRLVFGPVGGRLVGRLGQLTTFCWGLTIVALSSGACAFVTAYWQLLAVRAVGGAGSTLFTVSAASLLIRTTPPADRGRATGAWATAFLLGTLVGPVIGGAFVTISLRAPFVVYALLLLAVAVVGRGVLHDLVGGRPDPARPAAAAVTFPVAWRHPAFRAASASNFAYGWIVYGVQLTLVPLYVVEVLGRPLSWSGSALTATAAGTALTLAVGGRLADGRGRRTTVQVGSTITLVAVLLFGLTGSLPVFLIAALLAGVGTGLVHPSTDAAVADVLTQDGPDADHGTALAGYQMVGDVGAVIGPVLAGLLTDATGYEAGFALTALVAALPLGCWHRAPETLRRAPAAPA